MKTKAFDLTMAQMRVIAFLVPLLLSLPFLGRAYFVDDGYFVEIGSWLKDHPTLPYHFQTDDGGQLVRGWKEDGSVGMVNPLGHHYYLSLLLKMGLEGEWGLRLGGVLLSCFAGLILFELARRWTNYPLLSVLLVLVTPVHWLTAHSLLIDATLSCFFLAGLYTFLRGAELDSLVYYFLSGVFMSLAVLTKYTGLFILPLTLSWAYLYRKKISRRWAVGIPWVMALAALGLYNLFTLKLYGQFHILAASTKMTQGLGVIKFLLLMVFFSGVSIIPLVSWRFLKMRPAFSFGFMVFILTLFFSSSFGGYSFLQSFLIGLWFVTSLVLVFHIWSFREKFINPRDTFLAVWILGFILMMALVMTWVAARYFMLVIPAVVFFSIRLVEIRWPLSARKVLAGIFLVLFGVSGMLATSDYNQAEAQRAIGPRLEKKGYVGGAGRYYLGDTFTMSYLREKGWQPAFKGVQFRKGDLILTREITLPPIWNWRENIRVRKIDTFEFPSMAPLKVMHSKGAAGFYASLWGALPYTVALGPGELMNLYEVLSQDGSR